MDLVPVKKKTGQSEEPRTVSTDQGNGSMASMNMGFLFASYRRECAQSELSAAVNGLALIGLQGVAVKIELAEINPIGLWHRLLVHGCVPRTIPY
jgi:hypothetical protein